MTAADAESRANAGRKSIEQMQETAAENRLKSKKTVKQMTFWHGAPGSRMIQSLW